MGGNCLSCDYSKTYPDSIMLSTLTLNQQKGRKEIKTDKPAVKEPG